MKEGNRSRARQYPFIELSLACSNVEEMEAFWIRLFGGEVIFRGTMAGHAFSRMVICGVVLVFREDPNFQTPPDPGREIHFRDHIGLRVHDLEAAIADLESRGAHFVLTPARVRALQKSTPAGGGSFLTTDYIAPPLSRERIDAGEYNIEVAILVGPDNLWVELNEIVEPEDTRWFPGDPDPI